MHRSSSRGLPRPLRLGLPAVAALAVVLGGCSEPVTDAGHPSPPAAGSTAPAGTPSGPSEPSGPSGGLTGPTGGAGSDGLTVRHLDGGTVRTVRVEDFRS